MFSAAGGGRSRSHTGKEMWPSLCRVPPIIQCMCVNMFLQFCFIFFFKLIQFIFRWTSLNKTQSWFPNRLMWTKWITNSFFSISVICLHYATNNFSSLSFFISFCLFCKSSNVLLMFKYESLLCTTYNSLSSSPAFTVVYNFPDSSSSSWVCYFVLQTSKYPLRWFKTIKQPNSGIWKDKNVVFRLISHPDYCRSSKFSVLPPASIIV